MVSVGGAEFHIFGALIMGIIISIVEIFFVHQDEAGLGWMKHAAHAVPTCLIFTFISMNVPVVITLLNIAWLQGSIATYGIPILIGLIATFKVKAAAALISGKSQVGEKLWHALAIGALIAVSPLLWPLVEPILPQFLHF